jgi:hypothetical protein
MTFGFPLPFDVSVNYDDTHITQLGDLGVSFFAGDLSVSLLDSNLEPITGFTYRSTSGETSVDGGTAIPEPSSLLLSLPPVLIALGIMRRKRPDKAGTIAG